MDYDAIFTAFYTQYRGEAQIPDSTDDEYTIGLRLANEGINHWASYDGTYWKELYTTLQSDGGGDQTVVTDQTTYLAPGNFKEAGGYIKIVDPSDATIKQRFPIIEPQEVQFQPTNSQYAYFDRGQIYYSTGTASQATTVLTGVGTTFTAAMVGMQVQYATGETATITAFTDATTLTVSPSQTVSSGAYKIIAEGYTLNLSPAPTAELNGLDLDYSYYKKATPFTTGASRTEMADPYFIVHHMLANRFRASRNWSAYQTAKRDSENSVKVMQMDNNSGSWANPWKLTDHSGSTFGA
jgi:hypothetical protein